MADWDERFRNEAYPTDPDPAPVLREYLEWLPDGRALDVATGTGRNSVFLAANGYQVDAIDQSREGLEIARENARRRGVDGNCNWIQADAFEYDYPRETYDLITIRAFEIMDRLPEIKAALKQGGVLYYQPHLQTTTAFDYGPSDEHRVSANELLRACLDLTVLHYREFVTGRPDHRGAYAQIIARKTSEEAQSVPYVGQE